MNSKLEKLEREYNDRNAFTVIELIVIVATIAVVATMLLPALASNKRGEQVFQCMNNQRQIVLAWRMYADDNGDRLAINSDMSQSYQGTPSWISGWLDWSISSSNTNIFQLIDDRVSLLGSYTKRSYDLYRCPVNTFLSPIQRAVGWTSRIRSIAMNAALGDGSKSGSNGQFWFATKMSQLTLPKPAQVWVFSEEHPDSINDGVLYTSYNYTNGTGTFVDLPASYHQGACVFSFADGHVEMHRWQDSRTLRPVTYGGQQIVSVVASPDLAWLALHTPRPN